MFRALGYYDFEFYVDDNTTDEEIKKKVDEKCNYSIGYNVELGYEKYAGFCYRKKGTYY